MEGVLKQNGSENNQSDYSERLVSITEEDIEALVDEFPPELHARLEAEIIDLDLKDASLFLIQKLKSRRESLTQDHSDISALLRGVEILKEVPEAVLESILRSRKDLENFLGEGKNGDVFMNANVPSACYKVLFQEKARQLSVNMLYEIAYQHLSAEILKNEEGCAKVPEVLFFAQNSDIQVCMMEKVDGCSLRDILDAEKSECSFPDGFDLDGCFKKLEKSLEKIHEYGLFHNDLTNNAGNVMIDSRGEPWIIDFGAAVKSLNPDRDPNSYQLTFNGVHFPDKDMYGIGLLKKQAQKHLAGRE